MALKIQFINIFLNVSAFCVMFNKFFPIPKSWIYFPVFFQKHCFNFHVSQKVTHRVEDILNVYADRISDPEHLQINKRKKIRKKNSRQNNSTGTLPKRISKWPMSICKCSKSLVITKIKMISRRMSKIIKAVHIKD